MSAKVLNLKGEIAQKRGMLGDAEGLLERALELRRSKLGMEHPDTAKVPRLYGHGLYSYGLYSYGLYSCGLYCIIMAYIVMAYIA